MTCEKCGQAHASAIPGTRPCKGHRKSYLDADGNRVFYPEVERPACRRPAMVGLDVCSSHGVTKKARAAGRARETERKARIIVTTYGRPIETTATEALLDEVKWTAGYVAWLREKVSELDEAALTWGKTKHKTGGEDAGTTEEAKPHIYRQMLLEERQHLVKVCSEAIRAGIEERKVRLAEQQGALVADAIKQILDALNLTPEQLALVPQIVPVKLRLLTGGAA
jgi:hypothetical protein